MMRMRLRRSRVGWCRKEYDDDDDDVDIVVMKSLLWYIVHQGALLKGYTNHWNKANDDTEDEDEDDEEEEDIVILKSLLWWRVH